MWIVIILKCIGFLLSGFAGWTTSDLVNRKYTSRRERNNKRITIAVSLIGAIAFIVLGNIVKHNL